MTEYPNPATLRAEADRLERDREAISDSSEYPRVAKMAVTGQADALRNYAETIESVGDVPAKRPGMTGEERRERRAAILRLRAARLHVKANDGHRRSHDIGCRIPFGQPILVGHHSERGHRRAIEKMHNATRAAIAAGDYAQDLDRRADHVESSHAISQSDSDAVEQYAAKLETLTRKRDNMKATNAAWRKYQRTQNPAELNALGFDTEAIRLLRDSIERAYSWEKQPFPRWQISNLGAVIRDTEKRLERIRKQKEQPETVIEAEGTAQADNGVALGVRLEDSPEDNRVRLFFTGKPAEAVRKALKSSGFRWAPSLGCWQAFRNWRAMEHAKTYVPKPNIIEAAIHGKRVVIDNDNGTMTQKGANTSTAPKGESRAK